MRANIVEFGMNLVFPDVKRAREEIRRYESASLDEVRAMQLNKLNRLLAHHLKQDFYADLCRQRHANTSSLTSLGQIETLPVATKTFLREHIEGVAQTPQAYRLNSTSGSTGQNFRFYQSKSMANARSAAVRACYRWTGVEYWADRRVSIWGHSPPLGLKAKILSRAKVLTLNTQILQGYGLNETKAADYLQWITQWRPRLLEGYPGYLHLLAKTGLKQGIAPPELQAIVTSGEQLQDVQRQEIESYFRQKIFNRYGSREFGVIAHETKDHEGMHVPPTRFLIETSENGEFLITDLDNFATPFIRYAIGDVGEVCWGTFGSGLSGQRIVKMDGRMHDMLTTPSGKLLPGQFWTLLTRSIPGIEEFQVVQWSLDSIEMRIKPDSTYDNANEHHLQEHFHELAGDGMNLSIVKVSHIEPTKMGKRRFIIRMDSSDAEK